MFSKEWKERTMSNKLIAPCLRGSCGCRSWTFLMMATICIFLLVNPCSVVADELEKDDDINDKRMPKVGKLGRVSDKWTDSEETGRMKFPSNSKFGSEKPFFEIDDGDGVILNEEDRIQKCMKGEEDESEEEETTFEGSSSNRITFSVARLERTVRMLEPIKDPIKALFGLGLLLHGKSFAHLILFTQAFKVTGFPILAQAFARMKTRYSRLLRGVDKESVNPARILLASLEPDSLSLLLQGFYSGLVGCVASVVSPFAGATGIGLAIGGTVDEHLQPLLRQFLASRRSKWRVLGAGGAANPWVEYALASASKGVGVVGALLTMSVVNIMSGALLGAQLIVQVAVRHVEMQLKRMARRSKHALLHRAACNFNPHHSAVGGLTFALATTFFLFQMRQGASMGLFSRVLLVIPLLLERTLAQLKWALLARRLS